MDFRCSFDLVKFLIYIIIICTAVGVYPLVENYSEGKEDEWDDNSDNHVLSPGLLRIWQGRTSINRSALALTSLSS